MPTYKTRQFCYGYGYCIGIIHGDFRSLFIPGDVMNASTFNYPVLYEEIAGATRDRILAGDPDLTKDVVAAASILADQGVKGISGDSGFLLHYQDAITCAVHIPILSSSLLQISLISSILGREKAIAIICVNSDLLTLELIESKVPVKNRELIVGGLQKETEFGHAACTGAVTLDSDAIELEIVTLAKQMLQASPHIGAFVLECSILPPYSKAIQDATDLPVFDFITMIEYLQRVTHRTKFAGYY